MAYGIGAGGVAGIAHEVLPPPVQSALSTLTTGGTITAGTYRYVVTAINANGETTASNEQTITTTGSTSTVTVSWAAVTGATGYKLYKTAAGGGTGTELLYKTVGLVITDTDTAPGSPTGAFPTTNTADNPGVYVAPVKFFPFKTESIKFMQETIWRRVINNIADIKGAIPGNQRVEGDIELEGLEDVAPYFHHISRTTCVKTGSNPNFTYTYTPVHTATAPTTTASITIVRNGVVFGYVGCVVSSFKYGIDNGGLTATYSILGTDEASQTNPSVVLPSTVPFGAGQYNLQVPTASQIFDADTFEFTVDDSGEPQNRLKDTRAVQFIKFGERNTSLTMERDFQTRTDYDAFKALTAQAITIIATKGANNSMQFTLPAAIKDTYEVNLSGVGDLVRASIAYQGTYDNGTSQGYGIVIKTQENLAT